MTFFHLKTTEREYTVQVSYMEIYNENGFDLLDPNKEVTRMEDLPKVIGISL